MENLGNRSFELSLDNGKHILVTYDIYHDSNSVVVWFEFEFLMNEYYQVLMQGHTQKQHKDKAIEAMKNSDEFQRKVENYVNENCREDYSYTPEYTFGI